MLPIVNESNNNSQLLQIPDHLKCGEVYTWLCNGDLYAVECVLCEDKPLCPLSEFPQHMDIWHTDWEHNESDSVAADSLIERDLLYDDDDDDDDPSLSFLNEDSGLCEQDHIENIEQLEPFEQVLIEQEEENNTLTTNEVNEDVVEKNVCTATLDDTDYSDINEEDLIIEHDVNTLATMQRQQLQAKLKGEIVCAHNRMRHKQEIINKTITNRSTFVNEKKPKQKQVKHQQQLNDDAQQKQRETSEMEQTREQQIKEIETTNESNLNIAIYNRKYKRDPLTCKNRKRKCKQKLNRECLHDLTLENSEINGISRDLRFLKENSLENVNKLTGSSDLEHDFLKNELTPSNNNEECTQTSISWNSNEGMTQEKTNTRVNSCFTASLMVCKTGNARDLQESTLEHGSFMRNMKDLRESKDSNLNNVRGSIISSDMQKDTQEFDGFMPNMKDLRESEGSKLSNGRDSNNLSDMQDDTQEFHRFMQNLKDLRESKDSNLSNERDSIISNDMQEDAQEFDSFMQNMKDLRESKDSNLSNRRDSNNLSDIQSHTQEFDSFMQNMKDLRESEDSNLTYERDSTISSDMQEHTQECDSFMENIKDLRESEDSNLDNGRDSDNTSDIQENLIDSEHGNLSNGRESCNLSNMKENLNDSKDSSLYTERNLGFIQNLSYLRSKGKSNLNNKEETKSTTENSQAKRDKEKFSQQESLVQIERADSVIEQSFPGNRKSKAKHDLQESLSQIVGEENEPQEILIAHIGTDTNEGNSRDSNQLKNNAFTTPIAEPSNVKEILLNLPSDAENCCFSRKKLDSEEFTIQNENLSQENTDPNEIEEDLEDFNDAGENSLSFETVSLNLKPKSRALEEHSTNKGELSKNISDTCDIQERFKREDECQSKNVEILRETTVNKANGDRIYKNPKQISLKRCKIQRILKIKTQKRTRNTRNQHRLTFSQRQLTSKVGKATKCKKPAFKEVLVRTRSARIKLREKLKGSKSQIEENLNTEDSRTCQNLIDESFKDFPCPARSLSNPCVALKRKRSRNISKSNEIRTNNAEFSPLNIGEGNKSRNSSECANSGEEIILQPQEKPIILQNPKVFASNSSFSLNLRSTQRKINEKLNEKANSSLTNQVSKEYSSKKVKQTLVSQFFQSKIEATAAEAFDKPQFGTESTCTLQSTEHIDSDTKTCDSASLPSPHSSSNTLAVQLSPLSPKTEEEHFEFYEPKEKLTKHHVSYLIELYKQHPRLWDQSHADFCEPHLCRESWEEITQLWNTYCKRNFTIAEVRIRICTLCQRYLQERERLALEGELDEFAKFPYYEQMGFLELQKSLQKRKDLYDQQNEKLVEIYKHFPVLWHVSCYKLRQAKERANAFQSISKALKLCGIHLSAMAVQKRLRSLKKCYRLEKIRYLHAQVEQTPFDSNFRHFQKMQFLDKHIDPFVCRICGKIFENLTGFREHLEEENHGSILPEESDSESDQKENEKEEEMPEKKDSNLKECGEQNEKPIIQEVLIFPPNSLEPKMLEHMPMDDQIIEQMIESVANSEGFESPALDSFLSSVHNNGEVTVNNYDFVEEIVPDSQTSFINPNCMEDFLTESLENCSTEDRKTIEPGFRTLTEAEDSQEAKEQLFSLEPLVVKVQCADFSLDLKLDPNQETLNDSDNDFQTSMDNNKEELPLLDSEVRKMIGFYRKYPQLWNPNHLDFNSRNLRRQAWFTLTAEFCEAVGKQFSWRTLHRKLTDYAKYYKKLITEQEEDCKEINIKWIFYEDFKFLDDVIAVHDELQRSVHHRDNNFKIIAIYETLPQLWNIKHQDFNKRNIKQRNIELMCNRLQEENNLQITSERLKNRLIELRAQYRAAKKQRLKCEKSQQKFLTDFEFYEALKFLDDHIDPFICEPCKMEFKKLTDYNHHLKRQHESKKVLRKTPLSLLPHEPEQDGLLENVCHICGIKFTTRSNLMHHVKRHEGIRNYACPICPKKFFASHSLKVHIRSHTKECPYTCEKCGMSFVSASKLNQHVKRHSNKKDYACNYCPKAFYTAFERDRHERRHLNIRDKACPICGKTFVAGSSYYAHMMLHSDTKRFKCDKCNMEFAQYAGLYKHRKRHHGMAELK